MALNCFSSSKNRSKPLFSFLSRSIGEAFVCTSGAERLSCYWENQSTSGNCDTSHTLTRVGYLSQTYCPYPTMNRNTAEQHRLYTSQLQTWEDSLSVNTTFTTVHVIVKAQKTSWMHCVILQYQKCYITVCQAWSKLQRFHLSMFAKCHAAIF